MDQCGYVDQCTGGVRSSEAWRMINAVRGNKRKNKHTQHYTKGMKGILREDRNLTAEHNKEM